MFNPPVKSLALAALALGLASPALAQTQLHILHLNDFHSRLDPISAFGSTCSATDDAEGRCFGGAARLQTLVTQMRDDLSAAGHPVLVLDAGDASQGSLFYTTYGGRAEAQFLERLGVDAMAVGNHEFDLGPEGLAVFLDEVSFPILSTNLDVSANNLLAGRVLPHTILERGGLRIGLISALATDTPEIASPGPTVRFLDEIETLSAAVAELQAAGAAPIIALTHVGLTRDTEIAAAVPGLAAVIGGHSHTLMSSTNPNRQAPYPLWVDNDHGGIVPVVQAGSNGRYLGHLVLELDEAGGLLHAFGDTIEVGAAITPHPETLAWVDELRGPIAEITAQVVSEAAGDIDGARETCRQMECAMGNLVADAMLARVADQGITIAIQNGGGLRASITAGPVTKGQVLAVLPFQNTLATFQLSGADIVAALENGVSRLEDGAGRFAQVAGLRYTFDPALPAGSRVSEVEVQAGGAWAPIDPAAIYGVVSNDFMRAGGDGFSMFRDRAINAYDFGPDLADVLTEYMVANQPYMPALDGRITRR
jgi:5'-nucleotidase / UDP-sugar diphosphatase